MAVHGGYPGKRCARSALLLLCLACLSFLPGSSWAEEKNPGVSSAKNGNPEQMDGIKVVQGHVNEAGGKVSNLKYNLSPLLKDTGGENEKAHDVPISSPGMKKPGGGERRQARGMPAFGGFDPLGILKSATQMVRKGVHVFRESLHEGVKVAQMLKQDVNEGVTQFWGQKNSQQSPDGHVQEGKLPSRMEEDGQGEDLIEEEDEEDSKSSSTRRSTEESVLNPHRSLRGPKRYQEDESQLVREGFLDNIFRYMKVDTSKLGVIALNILIFIAEQITKAMIGKDDSSAYPDSRVIKDSLVEWMTKGENNFVERMLKDATEESLPSNLIETLKKKTGNSTSCVQLLLCKLSPVIWGVQKTVGKEMHSLKVERGRSLPDFHIVDNILQNVPSKENFVDFGDKCETKFPNCQLLKFSRQKMGKS